jgi:biopolymer transport protein ExbB
MIAGISIVTIMKISPVFDILLACSVLALAVILERLWHYRKIKINPTQFMERIRYSVKDGKYEDAINFCSYSNTPLTNVIKVGLSNRDKMADNISEMMESARMLERINLERFLGVLGTLGNSAPFIGLLGTVIGIIRAFKLLEVAGSAGPTAVMVGIAEALITTAMGLFVAIPCAVMFNYFMNRVKNFYAEMEVASKEFMVLIRENLHKKQLAGEIK